MLRDNCKKYKHEIDVKLKRVFATAQLQRKDEKTRKENITQGKSFTPKHNAIYVLDDYNLMPEAKGPLLQRGYSPVVVVG